MNKLCATFVQVCILNCNCVVRYVYFFWNFCKNYINQMCVHRLSLLLFLALVFDAGALLTLRDARTVAVFEDNPASAAAFGTLTALGPAPTLSSSSSALPPPLPVPPSPRPPLWTAQLVFDGGRPAADANASDAAVHRAIGAVSNTSVEFTWTLPVSANLPQVTCPPVIVRVQVDLRDGLLEFSTRFFQPVNTTTISVGTSACDIGIWSWALRPLVAPVTTGIFEPHGFGVVHPSPAPGFQFSGTYPQQTMQFMAAFNDLETAFYVAAHDSTAASKAFGCDVIAPAIAVLIVSAVPENAGLPLSSAPGGRGPTWPVVVAPYQPAVMNDWWAASSIYRTWALPNALWATQGPLAQRDDVPAWALNLTVWVNSHWQPNDIFNVSGGAPNVVEQRVGAIVDRFALGENVELGLHWYEWDRLGYEKNYTQCTSVPCGFDTHYPEYFPARDGFKGAMVALQQKGVRVCPYINGRIFDQGTKSWTKSRDAHASAAKSAPPRIFDQTGLALYNESYGSKAEFAVMCPHTAYWQMTIADVVGNLTRDETRYGTNGVYVDQVAAAGPRPCWDPSHGHPLGGGNHWVTGYLDMLTEIRKRTGNDKLLLTESNAEPFMGKLDMFLTLVGFGGGNLSPPSTSAATGDDTDVTDAPYIVPAFQSVYGGYVLFMGAEFFMADFLPNPNVFAAKIANQLLFGAQIGWFSLGGRYNIDNPVPLYDLFMDEKYDDEVVYLRTLSNAKRAAQDFLVHGRAGRFINGLAINGTADAVRRVSRDHPRHRARNNEEDVEEDAVADLYFAPVMTGTWLAADGKSLLVIMTTVERYTPATAQATLDLRHYGFGPHAAAKMFDVWTVPTDGGAPVRVGGPFQGNEVQVEAVLGVRAVRMLRVTQADEAN